MLCFSVFNAEQFRSLLQRCLLLRVLISELYPLTERRSVQDVLMIDRSKMKLIQLKQHRLFM